MNVDADVIIIGAGASGIAAAIELQKSSLSFIVLEARNRIGGRTYTDRETFKSTPIDLGASWIHLFGPENPLYSYYEKFKCNEQVCLINDDEEELIALDYDGKPLTDESEHKAKEICEQLFAYMEQFVSTHQQQEDRSIEDVIKPEYDRLVKSEGQIKRIVNGNLSEIALYDASDFTDLSAKNWATLDECSASDRFVSFGYGTLIERIANQQKLPIQLNTLVKHIDTRDPDRIAVYTSTSDSPMFCRRVLVTVPLGCLKQDMIGFEPPLPEWKREAISRMGYGLMNKLVFQFPECFWPFEKRTILTICQEKLNQYVLAVCLPSPTNIILLLVFGNHARELEKLTDEGILEQTMQFLRQLFSQNVVPDPTKYIFTRWGQDPLALGGYSNFAVHSTEQTVELLGKPTAEDRVHWAGEHTDMKNGASPWISSCVHNAFRSGQLAAHAIRNQLSPSSNNVTE